jgi:hypothetical protein
LAIAAASEPCARCPPRFGESLGAWLEIADAIDSTVDETGELLAGCVRTKGHGHGRYDPACSRAGRVIPRLKGYVLS